MLILEEKDLDLTQSNESLVIKRLKFEGRQQTRIRAIRIVKKFLGNTSSCRIQQTRSCVIQFIRALVRYMRCQSIRCESDAYALHEHILLMKSHRVNMMEQAVWALGNIANDGPPMRYFIMSYGNWNPLILLVDTGYKSLFLRVISKDPPPPPIGAIFNILADVIRRAEDVTDAGNACWALSLISDRTDTKIKAIIKTGIVPTLVRCLSTNSSAVIKSTLKVIGNIVCGNDRQIQSVINANVLPALRKLLSNDILSIKRKAVWIISKITAGTDAQIEAVIESGLMPDFVSLWKCADAFVRNGIRRAISNIISTGLDHHYSLIQEVLDPFVDSTEPNIIKPVLDCVETIVEIAEHTDDLVNVCVAIVQFGGLDFIAAQRNHENENLHETIQCYFDTFDTDDEDDMQQNEADEFNLVILL